VLNADDRRVRALAGRTGATVRYFGFDPALRELFPEDDELYGAGAEEAPDPDTALPATALLVSIDDGRAGIRVGDEVHTAALQAQGYHNALNATAAVALVHGLLGDADVSATMASLASTEPAFGRGEIVHHRGREVCLQLVKNPAGFRHGLRLFRPDRHGVVVIAINDDYADGRDISWLWDVSFRALDDPAVTVIASGARADDMALRLKYDDVPVATIEPALGAAVEEATTRCDPERAVLVYCTYTAMLELRRPLAGGLPTGSEAR
jgi:UDP-N-acetylmuramyl tripeptide synthase